MQTSKGINNIKLFITEWIVPIKGIKKISETESFLLVLPLPFFLLANISLWLLTTVLLLYWAMGIMWSDYADK